MFINIEHPRTSFYSVFFFSTSNFIPKTKENQQKKNKLKGETSAVNFKKPNMPNSSFILFSKEARKNLVQDREGISN
ncbi:hypothetical protein MKX03_006540, partial [Papaver bracteatum]